MSKHRERLRAILQLYFSNRDTKLPQTLAQQVHKYHYKPKNVMTYPEIQSRHVSMQNVR